MSYVPFRDNPELQAIPDGMSGRILTLVDLLEEVGRQSEHDHGSCYCRQGAGDYQQCIGGPRYVGVSAEEVVGLMLARGFVDQQALRALVIPEES